MFTTLLFIVPVALLLWGLSRATEKVLAIRTNQRREGKEPSVYL